MSCSGLSLRETLRRMRRIKEDEEPLTELMPALKTRLDLNQDLDWDLLRWCFPLEQSLI